MLQISFIRENKEQVIKGLLIKNFTEAEKAVEEVLELDQARRVLQTQRDQVLAESNAKAKEIGSLMKAGKKEEANTAKQAASELKSTSKDLNDKVSDCENKLTHLLYQIPNIPHESVPKGKSSDDNTVLYEKGTIPSLEKTAHPHWELIKKYDIVDFELGNKVTGAGFPFYKGKGARLQRAMVNFFLDQATKAEYQEIQPPIVINEDSGYGTGQLPDKEGQMYKIENHNYFLIPTAEVPITNMLRGEILQKKDIPSKFAGFTPCFRREAGNWGADVRGLNRLHQFDKVELVQVTYPENSYQTLEEMCKHVEGLLELLELPYRKLLLCGGDISFNAALCFDLEVYSAAQKKWLEVSSVSNFEAYQANRLKLRYRDENNKTQLLHTLNGSALALPRIMAAILENNQTTDGINIPKVLQEYCGFDKI